MRGYEDRRIPGKNRVTVAIKVDQIGTDARRDLQQPITGGVDIVPRIIHPLEPVGAFEQARVFSCAELAALLTTKSRAHGSDCNLDPVRLERLC